MPHATLPSLSLGNAFSPSPSSLKVPEASSPHILVIGGGVTACISSWALLDKGYKVTIVAKEFATFTKSQRLTSQVGAALWEFPCAPCGPQVAPENLEKVRRWAMESYEMYSALAADPVLSSQFGVRLRNAVSFSPVSVEKHESERERLAKIKESGLKGFRHDKSLLQQYEICLEEAMDAFQYLAPVIDTDQAMRFLLGLLQCKGAILHWDTIHGDLWENESRLLDAYRANVIVNASGLGSWELASDGNMIPARGGLLRLVNDGKDFEQITHAMVVNKEKKADFHKLKKKKINEDEKEDCNVVFIVPRNDNILVLGTFLELDEWAVDLKIDSPAMKTMREKCEKFLPTLRNARLDPDYPMAQGLRPLREGDVRVEREPRSKASVPSRIVHSYGHGTGGWTLAFGSALEVAYLVDQILEPGKFPRS